MSVAAFEGRLAWTHGDCKRLYFLLFTYRKTASPSARPQATTHDAFKTTGQLQSHRLPYPTVIRLLVQTDLNTYTLIYSLQNMRTWSMQILPPAKCDSTKLVSRWCELKSEMRHVLQQPPGCLHGDGSSNIGVHAASAPFSRKLFAPHVARGRQVQPPLQVLDFRA